jgi:hypothetical protein
LGDHFQILIPADLRDLLPRRAFHIAQPTLLALGDVAYDKIRTSELPALRLSSGRSNDPSRNFRQLGATGPEIESVAETFTKTFGQEKAVQLLRGENATRKAIATLAPKARFLHLATHSYFEPYRVPSRMWRGEVLRGMESFSRGSLTQEVHGLSPFTLCGIALSGANLPFDVLGRIDGVMTGAEIAELDLSNCELAVSLRAARQGEWVTWAPR